MRKQNLVIAGAVGTAVIAASALALPFAVSAQTVAAGADTFIQQLAAKLGISEDKVQTAVTEVRDQMHEERETAMKDSIAKAVADGKLTQRQADLLLGAHDAREEQRGQSREDMLAAREELSELSAEERQEKMQSLRTEREQELVAALNSKGLNTNLEELQAARDAARDAGVLAGKMGGRRGFGGPGMF